MRNYARVVYKIENKENGKKYIGSSENIRKRFIAHLSALRNNKHPNKELQKDWNEYGEESFKFEVLEKYNTYAVNIQEIEQYYIDIIGEHHLYNEKPSYSKNKKSRKKFQRWLKAM